MSTVSFSQACENNKGPILAVLQPAFTHCQRVLEIGSGTGQHAVHFATHMPHLFWQCSDLPVHHSAIRERLISAGRENIATPIALDVAGPWPEDLFDAVFTANTLHIMGWPEVEQFFAGVGRILPKGGVLAVYGPFNYNGAYTSDSNARFDEWLKKRDSKSGIRDVEAVHQLASNIGLQRQGDHTMPANNRCLVWVRR